MIGHSTEEIHIAQLIEKGLAGLGYEVVRIHLHRTPHPKRPKVLEILLDRLDETPFTIDDCVEANKYISATLDVEDPIRGKYHLDISSPGIARPLTKKEHFMRFKGKECQIHMKEKQQDRRKFTGILLGVEENDTDVNVLLECHDTEAEESKLILPLAGIEKAKLVIDETTLLKKKKGPKS